MEWCEYTENIVDVASCQGTKDLTWLAQNKEHEAAAIAELNQVAGGQDVDTLARLPEPCASW